MIKRVFVLILVGLAAVLAVSCGKKGIPTAPPLMTDIEILSGNGQTTAAGEEIGLQVRVTDSKGNPVESVTVRFAQITSNQGGYFPITTGDSTTTNASGIAFKSYTVDTIPGLDSIMAVALGAQDSVAYFAFTVTHAPADTFYNLSSLFVTGVAGDTLPDPFIMRVLDRYNNPIPNHRIVFASFNRCLVVTDSTRLARPYAIDTAITCTDQNGYASAQWILAADPGALASFLVASTNVNSPSGSITYTVNIQDYVNPLTYYPYIRNVFDRHCLRCHFGAPNISNGQYALDFYYRALEGGTDATANVIPGDTAASILIDYTSPLLHFADSINLVESDKIVQWIVRYNAIPGSSGLNSYNSSMKNIFDARCISCHSGGFPPNGYLLTTFGGIRGNGSDFTPNAIPGDPASLLALKVSPGGSMRVNLGTDSIALSDSIVNWIVRDSLRDY